MMRSVKQREDLVDSFNNLQNTPPLRKWSYMREIIKLFSSTDYVLFSAVPPPAWSTAMVPSHFFFSGLSLDVFTVSPVCALFPSPREPLLTTLVRLSLLCPSKSGSTTK